MASVEFQNATKIFGSFTATKNLNIKINDGEFVCLLGPSGCGKTTSLRMIAGLETPTSGKVLIGGKDVTDKHPRDRNISMVFQDYALYPHMNIIDNIAYPLKVRGEKTQERHKRAAEVADVLKIGELLKRLPSQISGGQQQRTSLARALVYPSQVYLFDEPLSNLDAKLRLEARSFLNHLQRDLGITAIYVTHDQAEAMALATRVAVMQEGQIVQFAPPIEIYRKPATTFVANFLGNPPMNLLPVKAVIKGKNVHFSGEMVKLAPIALYDALEQAISASPDITLGVRPEHLSIGAASDNIISGALFANENMGPEKLVTLERTDAARFTARIFSDDILTLAGNIELGFNNDAISLFDAKGQRITEPGEG